VLAHEGRGCASRSTKGGGATNHSGAEAHGQPRWGREVFRKSLVDSLETQLASSTKNGLCRCTLGDVTRSHGLDEGSRTARGRPSKAGLRYAPEGRGCKAAAASGRESEWGRSYVKAHAERATHYGGSFYEAASTCTGILYADHVTKGIDELLAGQKVLRDGVLEDCAEPTADGTCEAAIVLLFGGGLGGRDISRGCELAAALLGVGESSLRTCGGCSGSCALTLECSLACF
jgi:hypothetical protein